MFSPDHEHLLVSVAAGITGEGTTTGSDDMYVTWSCTELSYTSGCVQLPIKMMDNTYKLGSEVEQSGW